MIQIFEITDIPKASELCKRFDVPFEGGRVFCMEEGDVLYGNDCGGDCEKNCGQNKVIGVGLLTLKGAAVWIQAIALEKGLPFEFFDLLARSLLNVVRNMPNITVRTSIFTDYFLRFGLKKAQENDDFLQGNSNNITFTCMSHN